MPYSKRYVRARRKRKYVTRKRKTLARWRRTAKRVERALGVRKTRGRRVRGAKRGTRRPYRVRITRVARKTRTKVPRALAVQRRRFPQSGVMTVYWSEPNCMVPTVPVGGSAKDAVNLLRPLSEMLTPRAATNELATCYVQDCTYVPTNDYLTGVQVVPDWVISPVTTTNTNNNGLAEGFVENHAEEIKGKWPWSSPVSSRAFNPIVNVSAIPKSGVIDPEKANVDRPYYTPNHIYRGALIDLQFKSASPCPVRVSLKFVRHKQEMPFNYNATQSTTEAISLSKQLTNNEVLTDSRWFSTIWTHSFVLPGITPNAKQVVKKVYKKIDVNYARSTTHVRDQAMMSNYLGEQNRPIIQHTAQVFNSCYLVVSLRQVVDEQVMLCNAVPAWTATISGDQSTQTNNYHEEYTGVPKLVNTQRLLPPLQNSMHKTSAGANQVFVVGKVKNFFNYQSIAARGESANFTNETLNRLEALETAAGIDPPENPIGLTGAESEAAKLHKFKENYILNAPLGHTDPEDYLNHPLSYERITGDSLENYSVVGTNPLLEYKFEPHKDSNDDEVPHKYDVSASDGTEGTIEYDYMSDTFSNETNLGWTLSSMYTTKTPSGI